MNEELIKLCIDIEGRLRVLAERPGLPQALESLREDYLRFNNLMSHFLDDNITPAEDSPTPTQEKEAEAETAEDEPLDPADMIPRDTAAETPVDTPRRERTPLGKVLTLNDKFRFRRFVFECSDEDFMEIVSTLDSMTYPEAHDYITKELMLDENDPDVHDLLEILHDNLPAK